MSFVSRNEFKKKLKELRQKISGIVKLGYVTRIDSDDGLDSTVQVSFLGKTLDVSLYMPYGISANIPKGSTVVMKSNNGSSENNIGYGSFPENRFRNLKEWEVRFGNYKTKANTFYREDGQILINKDENDSTDFMVRFNELKKGVDQIVSDLNDTNAQVKNHGHATTTPGAPTGPAAILPDGTLPIVLPDSTADIDDSKIPEINVPEKGGV